MSKSLKKALNSFFDLLVDFGAIGSLCMIISTRGNPEIQNILLAVCIICNIDVMKRTIIEKIDKENKK